MNFIATHQIIKDIIFGPKTSDSVFWDDKISNGTKLMKIDAYLITKDKKMILEEDYKNFIVKL